MKTLRAVFVVVILAALLALPASAKGSFNIITVAGPGWYGEIEITDADLLPSLDMTHFMDLEHPSDAPAQVGRGYLITRGTVDGTQRHMFDRIVYFPGSPSQVYYLEIVNGAGPMDGHWYTVSEEGDQALAAGLQRHGGRLPVTAASPPADPLAVAASGGRAETAQVEAFDQDVPSAPDIGAQPLDISEMTMLLGAILLGGAAGWALRGIRQERIES